MHGEVPDNAYQEYFTVISDGMEHQNTIYANRMQSLCENQIPLTSEDTEFFEYGAELNKANVLWDSFEALYKQENIEIFEASFGHALRDKDINLQVSNLKPSENGDTYAYDVTIAEPQTDMKSADWNCTVTVDCEKDTGMAILENMVVDENISNFQEIGQIKQDLVTNIPMTVVDSLYPIPAVKAGTQMLTGITSQNIQTGDVKDAIEAVGDELGEWESDALENVGSGLGVVSAVADEYISAQEEVKKLETEIAHNRQYLNYCQNGELNKMKTFIWNNDTDMYASQSLNIGTNNITPEVRYNMMRWSAEGITACLKDLGVNNPEAVKEEMREDLTSDLEIKKITADINSIETTDDEGKKRKVNEEDVKNGINIMLDGGDFSTIEPEVRSHLQGIVGDMVSDKANVTLENGMHSWLQRRNVVEVPEQATSVERQTEKMAKAIPVQGNPEELIFKDELFFKALETGAKSVKEAINQEYVR